MAISFTQSSKTLRKSPALLSGQLRSIRRQAGFTCSMANTVRVGAVQMTSTDDLDANYATCSRLVKEACAAGVKFLCFPECFSFVSAKDGDSLKVSEPIDGPIMQKYCSLARYMKKSAQLQGTGGGSPSLFHHLVVDFSHAAIEIAVVCCLLLKTVVFSYLVRCSTVVHTAFSTAFHLLTLVITSTHS
ncbi:uncharacterized protein LOC110033100 [Phalaenopsis equestris]|uniref:uncharacterized protein LOC110033100 n=1 Tax=Phalaenopsis equestris TaxID=78828 RepID=UPI0009E3F4D4|nr:uncharacterized protein LOC110033100 [Phalaenopsis equestris]